MPDKPAFEVHVGDRVYRIWANGVIDGFEDGDKPIMIINRIYGRDFTGRKQEAKS